MKYFLTGLSLVLIAAKLFGAISISWMAALAPIWIPAVLGLLILITVVVIEKINE